jgi:hypothetical protein
MGRWNHYIAAFDASLRTSYRDYTDTFGVRSHTLGVDWVQPIGQWTVTPGTRYYTQSAARFYLDPVLNSQGLYDTGATIASALAVKGYTSFDQRLSAFGGVSLSMKLSYPVAPETVFDIKVDTYRQSASLRVGGAGSPNLATFHANFLQLGLTHRF